MHNTVSMPLSPLQVGEGSGARHSIMPAGVLSSSIPLGTLILLGRVAAELSCSWAGREPREAGAVATDLPFFLSRANFPSGHGAGGNIRQAGWWQGHPPDMHERGRAAGTRARARAMAVTASQQFSFGCENPDRRPVGLSHDTYPEAAPSTASSFSLSVSNLNCAGHVKAPAGRP